MASSNQYRAVAGGVLNDAQAAEVGPVISRLRMKTEGIDLAEAVEHEAHDPKSPLHAHFTWDLEAAAYERRLDQARRLVRSFTVVVATKLEPLPPAAACARAAALMSIRLKPQNAQGGVARRYIDVATEAVPVEAVYHQEAVLELARYACGRIEDMRLFAEFDELVKALDKLALAVGLVPTRA